MKRTFIGIILIVLSLAGIIGWEFVGREKLMYTEILTVNQDIEAGTEITVDMLAVNNVISPSSKSYRRADADSIVGKEATSFIPAGSELYKEFFADSALIVHENKGEFYFPIPSSWLVSYPQTLRRGDSLTFLTEEGENVLAATVVYVKDSSNAEVVSDNERLNAASSVADIVIIATEKDAKLLTTLANDEKKFVLIYR